MATLGAEKHCAVTEMSACGAVDGTRCWMCDELWMLDQIVDVGCESVTCDVSCYVMSRHAVCACDETCPGAAMHRGVIWTGVVGRGVGRYWLQRGRMCWMPLTKLAWPRRHGHVQEYVVLLGLGHDMPCQGCAWQATQMA